MRWWWRRLGEYFCLFLIVLTASMIMVTRLTSVFGLGAILMMVTSVFGVCPFWIRFVRMKWMVIVVIVKRVVAFVLFAEQIIFLILVFETHMLSFDWLSVAFFRLRFWVVSVRCRWWLSFAIFDIFFVDQMSLLSMIHDWFWRAGRRRCTRRVAVWNLWTNKKLIIL